MTTRYDELVARLREASQPDRPVPADFAGYREKIQRGAYTITNAEVQALKDAGYSEDEIFEQTVSAAVSAGLLRLDAALKTLG